MANRARLGLQIVSPWGSVNKLRIEVSPQITVADLIAQIQKDMGLENFTITIEEEVPGSDWGKDLLKGTLAENEVAMNATITVVSAKQRTWGDKHSHTLPKAPEVAPVGSVKNKVTTDVMVLNTIEPGAQFRVHGPGLNYQIYCPETSGIVVVEQGFGRFDVVADFAQLKCPCHGKEITKRDFLKISVNNCVWGYKAKFTKGTEEADRGKVENESYPVETITGQYENFVIATQRLVETTFQCYLCKKEVPIKNNQFTIAKKQFCSPCADRVIQRQKEKDAGITNLTPGAVPETPQEAAPAPNAAETPAEEEDPEKKSWKETGVKLFDVSAADLAKIRMKTAPPTYTPPPQRAPGEKPNAIAELADLLDDEPTPIEAAYEVADDEEPEPLEATYETA